MIDYAQSHDGKKVKLGEVGSGTAFDSDLLVPASHSPRSLDEGFKDDKLTPGIVNDGDPPNTESGMVKVVLDPQGRLLHFEAIPDQRLKRVSAKSEPFDWTKLFKQAQLDPALYSVRLNRNGRSWQLPICEKAWIGRIPGSLRETRIEAASFEGNPVEFLLVEPWTKAVRMAAEKEALDAFWRNYWSDAFRHCGVNCLALICPAQSNAWQRRSRGRISESRCSCF